MSLVVGLLALACSACDLGLAVDIDVDRDGGGTVALEVTADADLQAAAEQAGASPLDRLAERGAALEGWQVVDTVSEDGGRTVRLAAAFADPAAFETLVADLAEALNAPEARLLEPLELEVTTDEIRLLGGASLQPTAVVRDYGLQPAQVVQRLRRSGAFDYRVAVTMPGEVIAADGAAVEGQTATWVVAPGEAVTVSAVGNRPPRPLLPLLLAGLAGGALAAVGAWWVWNRSRHT